MPLRPGVVRLVWSLWGNFFGGGRSEQGGAGPGPQGDPESRDPSPEPQERERDASVASCTDEATCEHCRFCDKVRSQRKPQQHGFRSLPDATLKPWDDKSRASFKPGCTTWWCNNCRLGRLACMNAQTAALEVRSASTTRRMPEWRWQRCRCRASRGPAIVLYSFLRCVLSARSPTAVIPAR